MTTKNDDRNGSGARLAALGTPLRHLPRTVLERPIDGHGLHGSTLEEELGDAPTLLVFLRHYG